MADRPARAATPMPTATVGGARPERQQQDQGGGALVLLLAGAGVLGLGLYELTRSKCPPGYALQSGLCVPSSAPVSSSSSSSSSSSGSSSSSSSAGGCSSAGQLDTSPTVPSWWSAASSAEQAAEAAFYMLLGRWECDPINRAALAGVFSAPYGSWDGYQSVAFEIIANSGCEFFNKVVMAAGGFAITPPTAPASDPVCQAPTPNGPNSYEPIGAYQWIPAAFQQILGRTIDSNWVTADAEWLTTWQTPGFLTVPGAPVPAVPSWAVVSMDFCLSGEWSTRVQNAVAFANQNGYI